MLVCPDPPTRAHVVPGAHVEVRGQHSEVVGARDNDVAGHSQFHCALEGFNQGPLLTRRATLTPLVP